MKIVDTIGLPLLTLNTTSPYCRAIYAAPDDLSRLKSYMTYAARITKAGGYMVRFGVDIPNWTVEIEWMEAN